MLKKLKAPNAPRINTAIIIQARGLVQGLGFRPFVYNSAKKFNLKGFVRNTSYGAEIYAEGTPYNLKTFTAKLKNSPFKPELTIKTAAQKYFKNFKIADTFAKGAFNTPDFPPDIALCDNCRAEMQNPKNRRYNYPFTTCVKCGPRFSVIKSLPYDRHNTSMAKFKMCPECLKEYSDPKNRRFHAQTISCPNCGPSLNDTIPNIVKLLKSGKIIAIKSIGGYNLACDALNVKAVKLLRKRKNRPSKPFALMTQNLNLMRQLCFMSTHEKQALMSEAAPIVLLKKKNPNMLAHIAPDNSRVGFIYPYTPLHQALFNKMPDGALVMTSANISGEPIIYKDTDARKKLKNIADYFLTNNREITNPSDDSVIKLTGKQTVFLRKSRGYTLNKTKINTALCAFGAGSDIKNNFLFTKGGCAYLSRYTGDLDERENFKFYSDSVEKYQKILKVTPSLAACDTHPGYASSAFAKKFAQQNKIKLVSVQHHAAHAASVIAEHNIKGKCLAFSFDGTGYGTDGAIWGGEVLLCDKKRFKRAYHFDYFKIPSGDACAKNPWVSAVALLNKYGLLNKMPAHLKKFNYKTLAAALSANVNAVNTSSAGRLFDAVAALVNIKTVSTFEGEAPIALEAAMSAFAEKPYKFTIINGIISFESTLKEILRDISKNTPAPQISRRFHETLCRIITTLAKKHNIKNIILCGGVFQNLFLLERSIKKLKNLNFKVYFNQNFPIGDGGIAAGQAYMAAKGLTID
jgi:hydrogenase maturation protein HypF